MSSEVGDGHAPAPPPPVNATEADGGAPSPIGRAGYGDSRVRGAEGSNVGIRRRRASDYAAGSSARRDGARWPGGGYNTPTPSLRGATSSPPVVIRFEHVHARGCRLLLLGVVGAGGFRSVVVGAAVSSL